MAAPLDGGFPRHALDAAGFAETLAQEYMMRGGDARALFVAFAGLVSARDKSAAADCLTALDRRLFGDASAET